ncbi:MAG TPA: twin-arginine translocase TatA/TatE family subunit [Planctomycetota bacterium]|nr:twin-arginine translocase TatA/TatE family subunit [Planctomycetota bacterium]
MNVMMANLMQPTTLLLVVLVVVLLFGSSKIPQLMRGLGAGVNEFKKGLAEGEGQEKKAAEAKPADKPADTPPKA